MPRYLVAIHLPDNFDPSTVDKEMEHDVDVLNEEMVARGVRLFVGGLTPASSAKSLRAQSGGKVLVTDGPYLETKEHTGGFWVLEAAGMEELWSGDGRRSSPAGRRSRCGRLRKNITSAEKILPRLSIFPLPDDYRVNGQMD